MGRISVPEASFKLTTIVTDDLEFLIFLPLPSECWGAHATMSSFYVVLSIRLRGSYMLSKHSTNWATKFQILFLNWAQFTPFSRSVYWGHNVWCAVCCLLYYINRYSLSSGMSSTWVYGEECSTNCCRNPSRISMPTPMRVEGRRCNWRTEARTAPERSRSQVQFACPFYTQKPKCGPSRQAGLPEV